ncbi:Zinc protease [Labilithrix luteola]|uniref:Zinc protease n=1 Tax=Labilithrix luteola TaxID=1391654 RepID=A0A0K1PLP7_9BACT|nr:pitrilysin family protein [Labilithrix luteola]AKU94316.1 Zinc protease [Labilithrix luteola]
MKAPLIVGLVAMLTSACSPSVKSYAIPDALSDRRAHDTDLPPPVVKAATSEGLPAERPGPLDRKRRPLPKPAEARLSNGIRVVMVESHDFPSVSVGFMLDRGVTAAPPGVAKLYADALFGASKDFDSRDAYAYFAYMGAKPNSWAGAETIGFDVTTLSLLIGGPISRVGSMFTTPLFESDDLKRTVLELRADERGRAEAPGMMASAVLDTMMFSSVHPYGHKIERLTDERIKALSRDDLVQFRDRHLSADHVSIVVVGDFNPRVILPKLDRAVSKLPRTSGNFAIPPVPPPPTSARILVIDRKGASQSNIALGFSSVRRGDPAQTSLALLQSVLGRGLSGRLNIKTRGEHGSTYGVHVRNRALRAGGMFEIDAAVDTPQTVETLRGLLGELRRMSAEPLEPEEFHRARALAVDNLLDVDGSDSVFSAYQTIAADGLPLDYYQTKAAELAKLKPADIQAISERILKTESVQIAIVGDASKIAAPLRELGIGEVVVRDTPP